MKLLINSQLICRLLNSLLLSSVLTHIALAQNQTETETKSQKWYQIEVFIFAYARNNHQQELWPQDLGLTYPQRMMQLKNAVATEVIISDQTTEIKTIETTNTRLIPVEETSELLVEQPFTLLETPQLTFQKITQRLTAQRDIRSLFHAAWRQPILPRKDSYNILIRGGDQFDDHYELEGSINIGLERYLHISTDLWLSSFVSNVGLEKALWPILPSAPVTSDTIIDTQVKDSFQTSNQQYYFSTQGFNFNQSFFDTTNKLYSVDQTITMRQKRRMRSQELHYIDHPLMGLLVRIIPYEIPAESETTDSQQAGSSAR